MPKPQGWSDAELRKRDEIKDALMKDRGFSESRAYAIATAQVQGMRRKRKEEAHA
jgi:uncharacterized protein YdaT